MAWVHLATLTTAATLAGCGSGATLTEAGDQPPLTTGTVEVRPAGDTRVALQSLDASSPAVAFAVDDAGLLDVTVGLRNGATIRLDVIVDAALRDAGNAVIGAAHGSAVFLGPGEAREVMLSGPRPTRSIAGVTITITTHPSVSGSPTP